ncbi:MAG TPA: hypothetical protein VER33_20795 [Polyangiaceae bacterium]|nr:hypothetical protein [Polyangiaceae bacterium]
MTPEHAQPATPPLEAKPEGEPWPRFALAAACSAHAAVLFTAAQVLPWSKASLGFAALSLLGLLHGVTAVLAVSRRSVALRTAWAVLAWVSLAALLALSVALAAAAAYLSEAYQGIGQAIAGMLLAVWGLVVLLTLPIACWGLARTRCYPSLPARVWPLLATAVLVSGASVAWAQSAARAAPFPLASESSLVHEQLSRALAQAWPGERPLPGAAVDVSLLQTRATVCARSPSSSQLTLLLTYLTPTRVAESACLQAATVPALADPLRRHLEQHALPGAPLKLDLLRSLRRLTALTPLLDALKLRPALDGACMDRHCLAPWQLVALDVFTGHRPLRAVPDMSFGFSPAHVARLLGHPDAGLSELVAFDSWSFVAHEDKLTALSRLRAARAPATNERIDGAVVAARAHILAAQLEDGNFRYLLDPFSGQSDAARFNLARHAGTTLVLCELGSGKRVKRSVQRALEALAKHERPLGDVSALVESGKSAQLGRTALPLVAFLSCRRFVGARHDALIGRLAAYLLRMQRADGSFHPEMNLTSAEPQGSFESLYGAGQAVLALVLLEQLQAVTEATSFPDRTALRRSIDAAMQHYAQHWPGILYDFFFLEENWHCLAARAALDSHRNDAYEQFCLDYVQFKSRLILRADEGTQPDFVGGYGLGNVFVPHSTSTAGFAEALAAAIAVQDARGVAAGDNRRLLREVLGFVLGSQWDATSCFACTRDHQVVGGFSEHLASPAVRIDYVQHAMAALGHGAAVLGKAD